MRVFFRILGGALVPPQVKVREKVMELCSRPQFNSCRSGSHSSHSSHSSRSQGVSWDDGMNARQQNTHFSDEPFFCPLTQQLVMISLNGLTHAEHCEEGHHVTPICELPGGAAGAV